MIVRHASSLSALSADSPGQLDVFRHDGYALGVDRAQVRVLEETDEISFGGFLQSADGRALETQVGLEILSDLTNQTLERELPDQQLGTLLVSSDLTKSYSTGPEIKDNNSLAIFLYITLINNRNIFVQRKSNRQSWEKYWMLYR